MMITKKIMTITLNFYIIVNKIYLYNYNDKNYIELENKIYQNNILHDKNKQQKIIKKLWNYEICVLETIWETIEWNRIKKNKYII